MPSRATTLTRRRPAAPAHPADPLDRALAQAAQAAAAAGDEPTRRWLTALRRGERYDSAQAAQAVHRTGGAA